MSEENKLPQENTPSKEIETVEKQLIDVNPKLFEGVPKQKRQLIIQSILSIKSHSGPLPDIETLTGYANLIPNGADRVMKMAEAQSQHRMKLEAKVVGGQMAQSNLGQILAFLIGIAALGSATYCIINGHEWPGALLGAGGIVGLVTAFIQGKKRQTINLVDKRLPQKK